MGKVQFNDRNRRDDQRLILWAAVVLVRVWHGDGVTEASAKADGVIHELDHRRVQDGPQG